MGHGLFRPGPVGVRGCRLLPALLSLLCAIAMGTSACDQPATPSSTCAVVVSPPQFTPCLPGGTIAPVVTSPAICAWTAASNASWLTITAGGAGRGTGVVSAAYSTNYDAPREGLVTVRAGAVVRDIRVSQAGCYYAVTRSAFAFAANGGPGTFDVFQQAEPYTCGGPTQDACQWTAVSSAAWIAITTGMPRFGDDRMRFAVAPNEGVSVRIGTITVRDQSVQITQAGR